MKTIRANSVKWHFAHFVQCDQHKWRFRCSGQLSFLNSLIGVTPRRVSLSWYNNWYWRYIAWSGPEFFHCSGWTCIHLLPGVDQHSSIAFSSSNCLILQKPRTNFGQVCLSESYANSPSIWLVKLSKAFSELERSGLNLSLTEKMAPGSVIYCNIPSFKPFHCTYSDNSKLGFY